MFSLFLFERIKHSKHTKQKGFKSFTSFSYNRIKQAKHTKQKVSLVLAIKE